MIHLFFGLPLQSPDFTVYDYTPAWEELGEESMGFQGWLVGDGELLRGGKSAMVLHGGLGMAAITYTLPERTWDGASYTLEVELGWRYSWGSGPVLGAFDLGLGPHVRMGLPDWTEGILALTGGGHAGIGFEGATGVIRPAANLSLGGTFSILSANGSVQFNDTTLDWRWSAGQARLLLEIGVVLAPRPRG